MKTMKMQSALMASLLASALAFGGSALAADEAKKPTAEEVKADFQKADADKNGVISKQEGEKVSGLAAVFDKHDPDKDGSLDLNEFTAAMDAVNKK